MPKNRKLRWVIKYDRVILKGPWYSDFRRVAMLFKEDFGIKGNSIFVFISKDDIENKITPEKYVEVIRRKKRLIIEALKRERRTDDMLKNVKNMENGELSSNELASLNELFVEPNDN